MSTAGKVLIILFVLATLVWTVLASGVAQLNTNANTKLHELVQQVEKLEVDLKQISDDIVAQRNATSTVQDDIIRNSTVLSERQVDLEKARSEISETLSHVQYEVAIAQETVKGAQTALERRNQEFQAETAELTKLRSDVKEMMADCGQLQARLASLRKDFVSTYHTNTEMLRKAGRQDDPGRGGTN
jgi:chromosome segregation ATPase